MSDNKELIRTVRRSLNKKSVKFSKVARELTALGHDISDNYLAQLAAGRIINPRESRLLIIDNHLNKG
jgi:hypothetical protein